MPWGESYLVMRIRNTSLIKGGYCDVFRLDAEDSRVARLDIWPLSLLL